MEPATNNILRDRGLALQAIAAVDTAIWDVFGRAARAAALSPVGRGDRRALPISVIGGYYHLDAAETADDRRGATSSRASPAASSRSAAAHRPRTPHRVRAWRARRPAPTSC